MLCIHKILIAYYFINLIIHFNTILLKFYQRVLLKSVLKCAVKLAIETHPWPHNSSAVY